MAACSYEEQPQIPEEPLAPKTYTMTIEATKGSDTRALGLVDNALYAAWKKGEKVKVLVPIFDQTPYYLMIGELTAQGDGLKTILKGTVTMTPQEIAAVSQDIVFIFPVVSTFDLECPFNYTGQIGTLESIAEQFDYTFAFDSPNNYKLVDNEIVINDEVVSNPTNYQIPSYFNMQAIVRFNLMNQSGYPIYATSLRVHDSATNGIVLRWDYLNEPDCGDMEIVPGNPSNEIWAAICQLYSSSITLTATDVDNNIYTVTQDGVTWKPGNYYTVNVKMKPCHRVIIDPNMEHGTVQVSPSETLLNGEMFTLTIVPESANYVLEYLSYSFNGMEIPLTEYVENNTIQISMPDADVVIKATFKYVELYSIIDDGTTNGSISISPSSVVEAGTWVTLTMTPCNNYVFESLTVDNVDRTSEVVLNKYSFEMPDHDVNVTATFVETPGVGAGRGDYGTVNRGTWNNN